VTVYVGKHFQASYWKLILRGNKLSWILTKKFKAVKVKANGKQSSVILDHHIFTPDGWKRAVSFRSENRDLDIWEFLSIYIFLWWSRTWCTRETISNDVCNFLNNIILNIHALHSHWAPFYQLDIIHVTITIYKHPFFQLKYYVKELFEGLKIENFVQVF